MNKIPKVLSASSFLFLSLSIYYVYNISLPPGPWAGIYKTFDMAWILIICAIIAMLLAKSFILTIISTTILAATISLKTLRWGTVFGIRDPWIHIGHIQSGEYWISSRYPLFHSGVEFTSVITGLPKIVLMSHLPVFAGILGVLILSAIIVRIQNNKPIYSPIILLLFPVVLVDFNDRPISLAAVLLLLLFLVLITDFKYKSAIVLFLSVAALLYHPLIKFLFLITVSSVIILHISSKILNLNGPNIYLNTVARPKFFLTLFSIFVLYMIYWRSLGQQLAAGAIISLLGVTGESGAAGNSEIPTLYEIPLFIQETFFMSFFIIVAGSFSLIGVVFSKKNTISKYISMVSILGAGLLVVIFIFVDIFLSTGFPPTRAIPLAPILLIPGAIIGVTKISRPANPIILVFLLVIVVSIFTIFPSPLTGTIQSSSTPSDVDRTDWLVKYQGNKIVIEAENTYEITHANYGASSVERLANNKVWEYRSTSREEEYSWRIEPPPEGALVVNHHFTRENAHRKGLIEEVSNFQSNSNKVYSGGNSDIYWEPGTAT